MKIIHNAYVDERDILIHPIEHLTPGSLLLHKYTSGKYALACTDPSRIKLVKYQINITNHTFDTGQVLSISIELPPSGKYLIISIMDDYKLSIPYIYNDSPLFVHLFAYARCNLLTFAIKSEELIISDSAADELCRNQNRGRTNKISIFLTRRTTSDLSNLQYIRADYDQVWPIICYYELFTHKSLALSEIRKCTICPHFHHWISGLFDQYDKNIWYFPTIPLPIDDVPTEQKVLCSVISPKIKPYGKDMQKF